MTKFLMLIAVAAAHYSFTTSFVTAADQVIMPSSSWNGSVADEKLLDKPVTVVATAEAWQELWKWWKLEGETPAVDFAKNLVVVQTTRGSRLNLTVKLDDKGDLKVFALATRDLRPGFRYSLGVVSREGVKTVNGVELPKEEAKKPTITGSVEGPAGDLEPGLVVSVKVQDISLADAAAVVLGEQIIRDPKAFPIPFAVPYDLEKTNRGVRFSIGVRIEKEGKLKFINDTNIPVIKDGPTKDVKAPVIKIK
jgi:putative lipoprotein